MVVFEPRFGDADGFVPESAHFDHCLHVRLEGRGVAAVIAIHADEIDPLVARPAEQDASDGIVIDGIHLRRDGVDDVMHVLRISQVADDEAPEGDELPVRRSGTSPPVPGLGMFVQRAEDDGNGAALFIDHLAERFGYIVQPGLVFEVHGRTLLENPIDDLGVVPGRTDGIFLSRTFRQRIALVPDEHADAAPFVGLLDMADLGVVDSGHVQAVNGRMRSDDILDIGAVLVALPADTVRRVVVVAEHDAVQSDTPQIGVERFGFGGRIGIDHLQNCLFGSFEAFPFAGSVSGRTEQEAKPQQQKSFHKQVEFY